MHIPSMRASLTLILEVVSTKPFSTRRESTGTLCRNFFHIVATSQSSNFTCPFSIPQPHPSSLTASISRQVQHCRYASAVRRTRRGRCHLCSFLEPYGSLYFGFGYRLFRYPGLRPLLNVFVDWRNLKPGTQCMNMSALVYWVIRMLVALLAQRRRLNIGIRMRKWQMVE